ncbi:hypothetical protein K1T71_009904 [Dendrolimus kikuchii]|uniref:Uncharacterized protein n=1 Tax=Dendrolimus kikuchii TaxID=765133 RepID=A0ACC1CT04_9NEOP|nr:hypothetical protein K1T71_009904 [Dendrolimus kikuchii]
MEGTIKIQYDLQGKISSGFTNYKKSPKARVTLAYLETRLDQLEKHWTQFEANHYNIVSKAENSDVPYLKENIYDSVEEIYMSYKIDLKEALSIYKQIGHPSTSSNISKEADHAPLKLPKIILPSFSGQYLEWQTFHDLFETLIHKNTTLADVQKLHYLKCHLTGEAEQLLRHIPVTDANYESCWLLLKKRYSNKRYIANCTLTRLLGQRALSAESSSGIKLILDTTSDCLNALNSLGIDVSSWDIIVIYLIALKLDIETRKQWEQRISEYTDNFPTINDFKQFLESKYRSLEFLEPHKKDNRSKERTVVEKNVFKITTVSCPFCSGNHLLHQCKKFSTESYGNRYNFVLKQRLCFNCFGDNHRVYWSKRSTKCNRCGRRHHSLIHPEGSVSTPPNEVSNPAESHQSESDEQSSTVVKQVFSNHFMYHVPGHVILATAIVKVFNSKGECFMLRALLDQGSQASFITEHCAQMLGLRKSSVKGVVDGLGGEKSLSIRYSVEFNIQSISSKSFSCDVQAYVLKHLSSNLPTRRVEFHDWQELSNLTLADKSFWCSE